MGVPNDPPTATDDSYSTNEDSPLSGNVITDDTGMGADSDPNIHDVLSANLLTGPSHGLLTLASDGSFVFTPDADYYGPDSFVYELRRRPRRHRHRNSHRHRRSRE